LLLSDYTIRKW